MLHVIRLAYLFALVNVFKTCLACLLSSSLTRVVVGKKTFLASHLFIFPLFTQSLIRFISIPYSIMKFLANKDRCRMLQLGKSLVALPRADWGGNDVELADVLLGKKKKKISNDRTELRLINSPIKFFPFSCLFIAIIVTNRFCARLANKIHPATMK